MSEGIEPSARRVDKRSYPVGGEPLQVAFIEILAEDVHGAVDVGVNQGAVRGAVQAAPDAASAEFMWKAAVVLPAGLVKDRDGVAVQGRCLGGVALLLRVVLYPVEGALGGELLPQPVVRDRDEILVVHRAHAHVLLHLAVVAHHHGGDTVLAAAPDYLGDRLVEVVVDAEVPPVGEPPHARGPEPLD